MEREIRRAPPNLENPDQSSEAAEQKRQSLETIKQAFIQEICWLSFCKYRHINDAECGQQNNKDYRQEFKEEPTWDQVMKSGANQVKDVENIE